MTVREVDLSNNKFVRLVNTASTSVPENTIDIEPAIVLPYLIRLDVSNNKLSKLPKLMEVPSLQTLSFGNISCRGFVGRCHFAMLKYQSSSEGPNHQLRTVPSLFGCTRWTAVDLGTLHSARYQRSAHPLFESIPTMMPYYPLVVYFWVPNLVRIPFGPSWRSLAWERISCAISRSVLRAGWNVYAQSQWQTTWCTASWD